MKTIFRFALTGAANTILGLAVIMALLAAGLGDYAANVSGYAAGLVLSFFLNRAWTFGIGGTVRWQEGALFLLIVCLSYLVNLSTLGGMRALGFQESVLGQAVAMLAYSTCFFLLSRSVVFRVPARGGEQSADGA